jgi:putative ABC transport system ATP-binding protein
LSESISESILATQKISLVYDDGARRTHALREVSIEIPNKRFVGIMGPSGSGKSSLLYILSGLKRPTSGDVTLADYRFGAHSDLDLIDLRRQRFGFVFQQPYLLVWQTAMENVLMGAPNLTPEARQKAVGYFEQLGIADMADKLPSQLSGGEKQRVCVARAMMNDPDVIFADEPTASLDHANGHLVVDLLSAYRDRGTVVVVTHDPEMLQGADSVLLMRDGESLGWRSPSDVLTAGPSKTVAV